MSWGKLVAFDIRKCLPSTIRCPFYIKTFSRELVDRIDMKPFGDPLLIKFGDGNKLGYTLVQLIETSNITAHFCEEDNAMFLDVFSCKEFHQKDVEDTVYKYFSPESIHARTLYRG